MVTDSYVEMMSDVAIRYMLQIPDYGEDLGIQILELRRHPEASKKERELSRLRSGSVHPTNIEGSLMAVRGLFDASAISGSGKSAGRGFMNQEELRAGPRM